MRANEARMSAALLKVDAVSKRFGGFSALNDVSFSVAGGQRLGIIGPNGSGKTTLINCICGSLRNDAGKVQLNDVDITRLPTYRRTRLGIARSFQIPRPFHSMSLAQNVAVAFEYGAGQRWSHAATRGESLAVLERMGLTAKADAPVSSLTQVDLRRLELARALATRPRLLILDEVMAGLSPAEVDAMLAAIASLNQDGITIIMIEHIMRAIMRFSERVICLDAGSIVADGDPASVTNSATVRKIYLGG
jgi:branched-chain amino acid transport system ATP-binding protein